MWSEKRSAWLLPALMGTKNGASSTWRKYRPRREAVRPTYRAARDCTRGLYSSGRCAAVLVGGAPGGSVAYLHPSAE